MILSSTPLQLQGKMQPYAAVTKTYKDKDLVEVKRCWICKNDVKIIFILLAF